MSLSRETVGGGDDRKVERKKVEEGSGEFLWD